MKPCSASLMSRLLSVLQDLDASKRGRRKPKKTESDEVSDQRLKDVVHFDGSDSPKTQCHLNLVRFASQTSAARSKDSTDLWRGKTGHDVPL